MAEILTESFCERCGTRYTFESAAPKAKLKGLKVMSRGFRNFVLSDDTSMDEAMAAARNETDREQTSQQLDAFHKTFNFCMSCRQYTCGNCWNEAEGRCLSCAPELGQEVMPSPFGTVATAGALNLIDPEPNGVQDRNVYDLASAPAEPLAWPRWDLWREASAERVDGAFYAAIAAAAEDAANGASFGNGAWRMSWPRFGEHVRQRPSTWFQQLPHVYWRQFMQKLNVEWKASSCCAVASRSWSLRAAAIASSIDVSSLMTQFFIPFDSVLNWPRRRVLRGAADSNV